MARSPRKNLPERAPAIKEKLVCFGLLACRTKFFVSLVFLVQRLHVRPLYTKADQLSQVAIGSAIEVHRLKISNSPCADASGYSLRLILMNSEGAKTRSQCKAFAVPPLGPCVPAV